MPPSINPQPEEVKPAYSLTTHWNAGRHTAGEAMIEEILALGFRQVELGFDLTLDLVPGVRRCVSDGRVTVSSLHAICPLPIGAPAPHPELYTLANPDVHIRALAVRHLGATLRFAAEVGARVVVAHAGNVEMRALTHKLIAASAEAQPNQHACERLRLKLLESREKAAPAQLDLLYRGLDELLPVAESCGVRLAMELLPSWEAIPTEIEMEQIMERYASPWLRYWHDLGHGQIRENLGLSGHLRWLKRLQPYLAGMHVHDVVPPADDHRMPPRGKLDFASFRSIAASDIIRVLEPSRAIAGAEIVEGLALIRKAWDHNPSEK